VFFIPLFLVSRVSSFVYSSTTAVKAVRLAVCFTLYAQRDEKGDFFFSRSLLASGRAKDEEDFRRGKSGEDVIFQYSSLL